MAIDDFDRYPLTFGPSPVHPLRRLARARFASHDGRASVAEHDALIDACAAGDTDSALAVAERIWTHLTPPADPTAATEQPA